MSVAFERDVHQSLSGIIGRVALSPLGRDNFGRSGAQGENRVEFRAFLAEVSKGDGFPLSPDQGESVAGLWNGRRARPRLPQ